MNYFNKKKIIFSIIFGGVFSNITLAKDFGHVVNGFTNGILHTITIAALVFAFTFFLWRLFVYMLSLAKDPSGDTIKEGKKWLVYAVIILFIFVSIFALVNMVKKSLKLDESSNIQLNIKTHSINTGSGIQ